VASSESWIVQALAAVGISIGGMGVRTMVKQRELDVRLGEMEDEYETCKQTCQQTQTCIAAATAHMQAVRDATDNNREAINGLSARIDRVLERQ